MARTIIAPIKVQKFLKGMDYPAKKKDLVEHARKNKADEEVIMLLEKMRDRTFDTPAEVSGTRRDRLKSLNRISAGLFNFA